MIVSSKGTTGLGGTTANAVYAGATSAAAVIAVTVPVVGPIIGGVIAAAATVLKALNVGEGCGQPCIAATQIVNQAEPAFVANVAAYENGQISQSQALTDYNTLVQAVTQACGGIPGQPGQDCVSDRFTVGGCKWKATSQPYPASPAVGSCWNWDSGYRIPLTQPSVTPTSTNVASSLTSLVSGLSSTELLIGAGIVVVALMAGSN